MPTGSVALINNDNNVSEELICSQASYRFLHKGIMVSILILLIIVFKGLQLF